MCLRCLQRTPRGAFRSKCKGEQDGLVNGNGVLTPAAPQTELEDPMLRERSRRTGPIVHDPMETKCARHANACTQRGLAVTGGRGGQQAGRARGDGVSWERNRTVLEPDRPRLHNATNVFKVPESFSFLGCGHHLNFAKVPGIGSLLNWPREAEVVRPLDKTGFGGSARVDQGTQLTSGWGRMPPHAADILAITRPFITGVR